MNTIRALVRPVVTFSLVAAFIAAAFLSDEPAKLLAAPMGLAVGWYFRERSS